MVQALLRALAEEIFCCLGIDKDGVEKEEPRSRKLQGP